MKRIRIALLCVLVSGCTVAQESHKEATEPNKEITENTKPAYVGGKEKLQSFYNKKFNPALLEETTGRVYIELDISATGEVEDMRILHLPNTVNNASEMAEQECLRVAGLLPNWKPQVVNGKKEAAPVSFAVVFEKSSLTIDM